MKKLSIVGILALLLGILAAIPLPAAATSHTNCTFTVVDTTMTLDADCTTSATILVPNGFTLDGAGHTITAVKPLVGPFKGAVVMNAGSVAYVTNLTVTALGLTGAFDSGPNRLRGIMFDGASGSITRNTVLNIRRGAGTGSQEGNGIEVRNVPFDGTHPNTKKVSITYNTVEGYQKTGIVANGDVEVSVTNNFVGSANLPKVIAANSIQMGFGAMGAVNNNTVVGNQWDKVSTTQWAATAVLVYAAGDVNVNHNIITGNGTDVGILAQLSGTVNVMNNSISRTLSPTDTIDADGVGVSFYGNSGKSKVVRNRFSGWKVTFEGEDLARANIEP